MPSVYAGLGSLASAGFPPAKNAFLRGIWSSFCIWNCGGTHQCVIKAHVKDGAAVHVEPDDRYTQNAGREDQFLSDNDLILNNLQAHPRNVLYGSASAGLEDLE